jgi:hypothetical protein
MASKNPKKRVSLQEPVKETSPLLLSDEVDYGYGDESEELITAPDLGADHFHRFKKDSEERRASVKHEIMAADRLSMRLLEVDDDDSDAEERILRESLDISLHRHSAVGRKILENMERASRQAAWERLMTMICVCCLALGSIVAAFWAGVEFLGPPNQPVGPYHLLERQVRNHGNYSTATTATMLLCSAIIEKHKEE